jgi:hypothetical protein
MATARGNTDRAEEAGLLRDQLGSIAASSGGSLTLGPSVDVQFELVERYSRALTLDDAVRKALDRQISLL